MYPNNNTAGHQQNGGGFKQISANVIHNQQQPQQVPQISSSSSSSSHATNAFQQQQGYRQSLQNHLRNPRPYSNSVNGNNNNVARYEQAQQQQQPRQDAGSATTWRNNNSNINVNNNLQHHHHQVAVNQDDVIRQENDSEYQRQQQQQQQQQQQRQQQLNGPHCTSATSAKQDDEQEFFSDAAVAVASCAGNTSTFSQNANPNTSSNVNVGHRYGDDNDRIVVIPIVDAASTNKEPNFHTTSANSHGNRVVMYDYVSSSLPPVHHSTHYHGGGARPLCCSSTQHYVMKEKLGQGTYGVVFRCEDTRTGASVAMKKIAEHRPEDGVPAIAIREIALLREVQHPNVVALFNVIPRDRELLLIFEYVDQDLKKLLDSRITPFQGLKLKWIMYQLLQGMAACHAKRIVHRDLKPQNILVSKNEGVVKIADFGLARAFHVTLHTYTKEVVTLWYRAPEILLGEQHYRPAIDIWSLGCIMAELATKRPLFPGDCEIHQLFLIFKAFGTPSEASWPGVSQLAQYNEAYPQWKPTDLRNYCPSLDAPGLNLLRGMLQVDPLERISAPAALMHPWFDEIRDAYSQQFSEYRKW